MRIPRLIVVNLLLLALTFGAAAAEHVVKQKQKRFEPEEVRAKVGDTLVFVNDDQYAHNVFSETSGFEFSIRKQEPGVANSVKLDKRGEFEVECIIHPRMKLKVVVE